MLATLPKKLTKNVGDTPKNVDEKKLAALLKNVDEKCGQHF
jgi:hypothetical protein